MGGWVVGGRVVGSGSCLFEDKKKKIYISSLSARSKFAIARSRIKTLSMPHTGLAVMIDRYSGNS